MTLLEASGLCAGYGPVEVLRDLDFRVDDGEIVVVLGANGSGKTTTMRAVSGTIRRRGELSLDGESIVRARPDAIVRRGVAQVPQGRGTIVDLSVEENLRIGAYVREDKDLNDDIQRWFEIFPRLGERSTQKAGLLSGGEQQMLAIARALMCRPRLLLCDEPSLGLAPVVTQELFEVLRQMNEEYGVAMLIVEQNAALALSIASRAYVLEAGEIVAEGTAAELSERDTVRAAYLGY